MSGLPPLHRRLSEKLPGWQAIGADPKTLKWIKHGVPVEFLGGKPPAPFVIHLLVYYSLSVFNFYLTRLFQKFYLFWCNNETAVSGVSLESCKNTPPWWSIMGYLSASKAAVRQFTPSWFTIVVRACGPLSLPLTSLHSQSVHTRPPPR